MLKLYKFHLALNPPLVVNPLATVTPQVSMDPIPCSTSKKTDKNHLLTRSNINVVDSNINTRQINKMARRLNKRLKMEKFKVPPK